MSVTRSGPRARPRPLPVFVTWEVRAIKSFLSHGPSLYGGCKGLLRGHISTHRHSHFGGIWKVHTKSLLRLFILSFIRDTAMFNNIFSNG